MPRTVLIVDDHAEFRTSARALLEAEGFVVAGEAADGAAALAMAALLRPAVVLLDVALPDIDGITVATRLSAHGEPPAIVLISSRERDTFGSRLEIAGIRGFISKADLSGATLSALVG